MVSGWLMFVLLMSWIEKFVLLFSSTGSCPVATEEVTWNAVSTTR